MNTLIKRMNAEGLNFNTIKTAIIACGDALRSRGVTRGPFKVDLSDLPRYNSLYRNMVLEAAPGVQSWEEIAPPFPEPAWEMVYEFHTQSKWMAMREGTPFTVEIEYTTWWCHKVDNERIVIEKIYDARHEQWEEEQYLFLPPGIRAAVAKKIGADFSSSTFHGAFDAIVGGYAIY